MRSDPSSVAAYLLLGALCAIVAAPGCDAFGSGSPDSPPADQPPADGGAPDGDGPKAPPVGGPTTSSELTNALGVFVANTGSDSADGTSERPLARIQPAIDLAKRVGKRVYVCAGTYLEALVIADSISIVGGLDCSAPTWKTSNELSRVEAPTSPAIRASNITSPTRLEALDVTAPSATVASGSSIGLVADKAGALVVARSKITAGNAMKGDNGVEGIQLANAGTTKGLPIPTAFQCTVGPGPLFSDPCGLNSLSGPKPAAGALGGTNTCVGAPGFVMEAGGQGGTGGLYDVKTVSVMGTVSTIFVAVANAEAKAAPPGRTGAPGVDSPDGAAAAATGAFSANGYTPADGNNGNNGGGGSGGSGGDGLGPGVNLLAAPLNAKYRGWGGGGGGAGGCPGLAGTAGNGGGASVAALLIDGAVTFDGVQLVAGNGGDAGHGTLGSTPLPGGLRNNPQIPSMQYPELAPCVGDPGGRGGAAGVSTNGSSGPSAGIAHVGAAPKIVGDTKMTPGQGGAGVAVQSRTDLGITKTVPATEPGVSKQILAL